MNDPRRDEARRLRAHARMSLAQLRDHFGVSRDTLADWLWGEPVPDWTRRPNAKDELREQAIQLRSQGRTVPQISAELGVANPARTSGSSTCRSTPRSSRAPSGADSTRST